MDIRPFHSGGYCCPVACMRRSALITTNLLPMDDLSEWYASVQCSLFCLNVVLQIEWGIISLNLTNSNR